uniref:Binding-protein-dependent transport systems inner membrane component n=2 Tax=Phyllobacteriaceae TaxID=69277 RepID=Q11FR8_CHESB
MYFILPLLIYMAAVFLLPLLFVLFTSVVSETSGQLTLEFFERFFTHGLYLRVLKTTLEISLIGTALTLLIAYPIAYYLAKQTPKRRSYLTLLILLPFYTSILVKAFAFMVVLGYNGVVNDAIRLVLGEDFVLPLLFNRFGVMIGVVHDMVPFMVFPIVINLLAQNSSIHKAAEIMGATRTRIFWSIIFPLSLPAVAAGSLLVIIRLMGQFVTPALLGGRTDIMMSNLISFHIKDALDWNMAAAVSIVLLLLSCLILLALTRVRGAQLFGEQPRHG